MHPHLRSAGKEWRNVIQSKVSMNKCFIKCGRKPLGRGFYWYIHPACIDMFRCGDFDPLEIRWNITKYERLLNTATSNSLSMRSDNQNTIVHADQGTTIPLNQTNMASTRQNFMTPVGQESMTAVNQCTLTNIAQNIMTPANQTAVTAVNQATTIVAPYSSDGSPTNHPVMMGDNQSSSPPGNHNQLHGYQFQYSAAAIAGSEGSRYSQYCSNMGNYHTELHNYNWMPTSSHFNYSLCSYL